MALFNKNKSAKKQNKTKKYATDVAKFVGASAFPMAAPLIYAPRLNKNKKGSIKDVALKSNSALAGFKKAPVAPTTAPVSSPWSNTNYSNNWQSSTPTPAATPAITTSNPLLAFDSTVGLDIPNGINDEQALKDYYQQEYERLGSFYNEQRDYELDNLRSMRDEADNAMRSYLADSEANLQQDRDILDSNEAQSGTLFSTGRTQRRQSLQDQYNRNIANKRAGLASGLSDAARSAEFNLGSRALRGMNFNLSEGTADAQSLRPGVGINTGLSSAYSASNNYSGELPRARRTNAMARANARLGARNNRQLPGYYSMN